jgi:NDP-sugar pyrophosphorylase family protein
MKPQLIIPMTGVSSRFTAAGYKLPKFLLQVDGQTVIEHVLDMFPDWDDVVFCCNEIHLEDPALDLAELLLSKRPKAKIVKVSNNQKGPGWAVLQARQLIEESRPVVVNYCDFTCYWDSTRIAEELASGNVEGCIPAYTGFHPHMAHSTSYAYLKFEDDLVVDIQEKQPWTDNPKSEFASSGTYGFASGKILFDSLDAQIAQDIDLNGEYYLSLTYKPLLAAGGRVSTIQVQHFMQWGTPQDFEEYSDTSRALGAWTRNRAGNELNQPAHSKVILASGAGSRFSRAGYRLPKPALPLAGKTLLEHSLSAVPGVESVVVSRKDLEDDGIVESVATKCGAEIVWLAGLSRGQAESALIGLKALTTNAPVTVTACDAIPVVTTSQVDSAISACGPNGLLVWVSNPYHSASRKPESYGWVTYNAEKQVTGEWIKANPPIPQAGVLIGTFSFGSRDYAIEFIEDLIEQEITVNGEFYLDSLVRLQLDSGMPCIALEVPSFVSVGTPEEYESVRYWQSCFDKWPLHPYKLKNDPMVSQADIMQLAAEFRKPYGLEVGL